MVHTEPERGSHADAGLGFNYLQVNIPLQRQEEGNAVSFNYSEHYLQGPLSCSPDPGDAGLFFCILAQTDHSSIILPQLCCTLTSPRAPASCLVGRALEALLSLVLGLGGSGLGAAARGPGRDGPLSGP